MGKATGGPAFPFQHEHGHLGGTISAQGMTLRQWYAGQALAGLLSTGMDTLIGIQKHATERGLMMRDVVAAICFEHADALIAHETAERIDEALAQNGREQEESS